MAGRRRGQENEEIVLVWLQMTQINSKKPEEKVYLLLAKAEKSRTGFQTELHPGAQILTSCLSPVFTSFLGVSVPLRSLPCNSRLLSCALIYSPEGRWGDIRAPELAPLAWHGQYWWPAAAALFAFTAT